jgi:hypothetical protein
MSISAPCRTAIVECNGDAAPQSFRHDPDSRLDYGMDWAGWLSDGHTLASAAWSITPAGPILDGEDHDADTAVVFVAGCVVGVEYRLRCEVVASGSPAASDARSIVLAAAHR